MSFSFKMRNVRQVRERVQLTPSLAEVDWRVREMKRWEREARKRDSVLKRFIETQPSLKYAPWSQPYPTKCLEVKVK